MTVARLALLCLVAGCIVACSGEDAPHSLLPDGSDLRPGDLLFRRGTSMASRGVVLADGNGRYSHVGIVVDSAGTMMVVHAVPDEPDYEGDPDRVKMDKPSPLTAGGRSSTIPTTVRTPQRCIAPNWWWKPTGKQAATSSGRPPTPMSC